MRFEIPILMLTSFGIGIVTCLLFYVPDIQQAYTDGRESVLSKEVTIGKEETPCSVSIPLSALAEMVSVGVIEWHQLCKEQINDQ